MLSRTLMRALRGAFDSQKRLLGSVSLDLEMLDALDNQETNPASQDAAGGIAEVLHLLKAHSDERKALLGQFNKSLMSHAEDKTKLLVRVTKSQSLLLDELGNHQREIQDMSAKLEEARSKIQMEQALSMYLSRRIGWFNPRQVLEMAQCMAKDIKELYYIPSIDKALIIICDQHGARDFRQCLLRVVRSDNQQAYTTDTKAVAAAGRTLMRVYTSPSEKGDGKLPEVIQDESLRTIAKELLLCVAEHLDVLVWDGPEEES